MTFENEIKIVDLFKTTSKLGNKIIRIVSIGKRKKTFVVKFIDETLFNNKTIFLKIKSFSNEEYLDFSNFTINYSFKKMIDNKYYVFSFSNNDRTREEEPSIPIVEPSIPIVEPSIPIEEIPKQIVENPSENIKENKNINKQYIIMTSNNIFNSWMKSKDSLKPNSIKNYQNQFKFLTRIILDNKELEFNTLPNSIDYLLDPSKVISIFTDKGVSIRSQKLYLSIINQVINSKYPKGNGYSIAYINRIDEINEELDKGKLDQVKSKPQLENWVDWNTLESKYKETLKNHKFGTKPLIDLKLLILSILILQPVRRISDIRLLKVYETNETFKTETKKGKSFIINKQGLDEDFNYYSPKTNQLIFLNYKTNKLYGEQVFNIDDYELVKLLDTYIKLYKITNNELIFKKKDNTAYQQTDFTSFIIRYTKKIYGKEISPSLFRTIYCSSFYSKNPSNKDADICSKKLAHSVEEARMTYSKR